MKAACCQRLSARSFARISWLYCYQFQKPNRLCFVMLSRSWHWISYKSARCNATIVLCCIAIVRVAEQQNIADILQRFTLPSLYDIVGTFWKKETRTWSLIHKKCYIVWLCRRLVWTSSANTGDPGEIIGGLLGPREPAFTPLLIWHQLRVQFGKSKTNILSNAFWPLLGIFAGILSRPSNP